MKPSRKPDLGAVFDLHVKCEFEDHDVDATMRTMVDDPYVHNVPVLKGGYGREGVYDFYRRHFVGKMPADTRVEPISRTVGSDCAIDELIVCFTHDIAIDYLLPGIAPTGKYVELPHVVIMKFEDGKVAYEHIYWDQACLLAQVGLIDSRKLPVTGKEQAARLRELTRKKRSK
jgi:carboxymethylenebutenolidase